MKKHIIFLVLAATTWAATAQTQTYRQRLEQEIQVIEANGNCIVRLKQDTCNYIEYRSADGKVPERLVVVENNKLTTTEEAADKTLYVGTTAKHLELTITGDAMVLYKDKVYAKCQTTIDTNHTVALQTSERDWTGLTKYKFDDRFYYNLIYGWTILCEGQTNFGGTSRIGTNDVTKLSFGSIGLQMGYSIYMDNHFAAGIGLEVNAHSYNFSDPYVAFKRTGTDVLLSRVAPDDGNTWEKSYINTFGIGMPIHFTFYPIKKDHDFNLRLDFTPYFNCYREIAQEYSKEDETTQYSGIQTSEFPANIFNVNARFSVNWDVLGIFAETDLLPINNNIRVDETFADSYAYMNGHMFPYHVAFGFRFSL